MLDGFIHTHFTREIIDDCPGCQGAEVVCHVCLGQRKVQLSGLGSLTDIGFSAATTAGVFKTCPRCSGTGKAKAYPCRRCGEMQADKPSDQCEKCFVLSAFGDGAEMVDWVLELKAQRDSVRLKMLAEIEQIERDLS